MRAIRLASLALLASAAACAAPQAKINDARRVARHLGASPFDVLTEHNDPQRTGATLAETMLTPASVGKGSFGLLFDWKVDGQIYGQPLYLSSVPYGGRTINMVVVATMNNSVYAFEAPQSGSSTRPSADPLWHTDPEVLGPALPFDYFSMEWGILGHNIWPKIGITSTPVIDRSLGRVFVTVKSGYAGFLGIGQKLSYQLVALDLLTGGVEQAVDIDAETGDSLTNGATAVLDYKHHLQRAALLESDGQVYLAFGSHQDSPTYHGWVVSYLARDITQRKGLYCSTCAEICSNGGGIWQAGGGPAADAQGNVYVMTGNGSFAPGTDDRSVSFIKLDSALHPVGSFTPANYGCLNLTDSDLASAGPLFLSDTSTLVGGGKEGLLYAVEPEALSGTHIGLGQSGAKYPCYRPGDPQPLRTGPGYSSLEAALPWDLHGVMNVLGHFVPAVLSQGYHHIHGSPVAWRVRRDTQDETLLYVSAERDLLRAYSVSGGVLHGSDPGTAPRDRFHSMCKNSDHGMPGGFLTVSADGDKPDTGIVWASMPRFNKNALNYVVPGVLRAYRAYPGADGARLEEIWNSDNETQVSTNCTDAPPSGPSQVGLFAKGAAPTVAEGKVYLATFSNRLAVYGLRAPKAAGEAPAYEASAQLGPVPSELVPGATVAVSVTVKNTGSMPWRASDRFALIARIDPEHLLVPSEGAGALALREDMPPGATHTFLFHLRAPQEEGEYYFAWQMVRGVPSDEPVGSPTSEWRMRVLRPDCADLRTRAAAVTSRVPTGGLLPPSLRPEVESLVQDAKNRKCLLGTDSEAMPGM
jgi:hypothetical protein